MPYWHDSDYATEYWNARIRDHVKRNSDTAKEVRVEVLLGRIMLGHLQRDEHIPKLRVDAHGSSLSVTVSSRVRDDLRAQEDQSIDQAQLFDYHLVHILIAFQFVLGF